MSNSVISVNLTYTHTGLLKLSVDCITQSGRDFQSAIRQLMRLIMPKPSLGFCLRVLTMTQWQSCDSNNGNHMTHHNPTLWCHNETTRVVVMVSPWQHRIFMTSRRLSVTTTLTLGLACQPLRCVFATSTWYIYIYIYNLNMLVSRF